MDIPKIEWVPLATRAKRLGEASQDVSMGIATHAEKESAQRGIRLRDLEAKSRMAEHKVIDVTKLQSGNS